MARSNFHSWRENWRDEGLAFGPAFPHHTRLTWGHMLLLLLFLLLLLLPWLPFLSHRVAFVIDLHSKIISYHSSLWACRETFSRSRFISFTLKIEKAQGKVDIWRRPRVSTFKICPPIHLKHSQSFFKLWTCGTFLFGGHSCPWAWSTFAGKSGEKWLFSHRLVPPPLWLLLPFLSPLLSSCVVHFSARVFIKQH